MNSLLLSRYSIQQQKILFWSPKIPALISIVCSCLVAYHLIRDYSTKLSKVYGRMWFGLTIGNILVCIMTILSSIPAPADGTTYYGAQGSDMTCTASAAIFHFVFLNCMGYNASLGVYYYISVHYTKWNDDYVRRKIEPWFHIVSFAYPLLGVIFGLCFHMYGAHDMFLYCWASPTPFGCRLQEENGLSDHCTSGNHFRPLFIISTGLIELNFLTIMKLMGVFSIYFAVSKQQKLMQIKWNHNAGQNTIARETGIQALLFMGACLVPYTCSIIFRILDMFFWTNVPANPSNQAFFIFATMTHCLFPLQGVLNLLLYFRPKVLQYQRKHKGESLRESLQAVWDPTRLSSKTSSSRIPQTTSITHATCTEDATAPEDATEQTTKDVPEGQTVVDHHEELTIGVEEVGAVSPIHDEIDEADDIAGYTPGEDLSGDYSEALLLRKQSQRNLVVNQEEQRPPPSV